MNILRKLGASLCAALLSVGLFGLAWSNVGLATIHDRDSVKGWLNDSGFYTKIVDLVLEKAKTSGGEEGASLPITDPEVQAIAKSAFSPEFLQTNVEKFLDGGYDWMSGKTDNLDFSLDLSSAKQQLAVGLGNYAATKAQPLPVCATNESASSFDAFSSVCLPRGLSAAAAGQELASKLSSSTEFLGDSVITASDIKVKNSEGQDVPLDSTEQASAARRVYRLSGLVPLMFGILALITALGVIFISRDRMAGIRRVGYVFLVTGTVLLFTYIALGVLSSMASQRLGDSKEAGMVAQNQLIADMARVVFTSIQKALVLYTAGYIGLGLAGIIGGTILKKRRDGDKKPSEAQPTDQPAQPAAGTPSTDVKLNQKPKPRKIQL